MRLGRCYVELHYGTVLWILLLGGKLRTVRPAKSSHGAIRSYAIPVFARNVIQSNPALRIPHYYVRTEYFMEVRVYGIYARVADVSVIEPGIERVSGHLH